MAISPPNWAKHAVPSPNGWRHPRTGEMLKPARISQEDIDEFYGVKEEMIPTPQMLTEAPTSEEDFVLEHMTKVELEEVARTKGVELDRRLRKETLLEQVKSLFGR